MHASRTYFINVCTVAYVCSFFNFVVSFLDHQHVLLISAACLAISELGRCGPLPLPKEDEGATIGKLGVVKKLQSILNNAKLPSKVNSCKLY